MFEKKNNSMPGFSMNDDIRAGSGSQAKPTLKEPVYTMPEKFMQTPANTSPKNGKKRLLVLVAVVLALAIIFAAIAVFFIQEYNQEETPATTETLNQNQTPEGNTTDLGDLTSNENEENANSDEENDNTTSINLDVDPELEENINAELFGNSNNTNELNVNENVNSTVVDHGDVPDASDKDKDDLTDIEEEVYATKNHLPDNDRDGYVDGVEVRNLYSPLAANEDLIDSELVIEYQNDVAGWSVFYPAEWLVEPVDKTKKEVLFTSPSVEGEFIQIAVENNTEGYSAVGWYDSLFEEGGEDLEEVNISGLDGVISADGLRYYFANDTHLISIVYNIGLQEEIAFRTTFQMMVNSFVYTSAESSSTTDLSSEDAAQEDAAFDDEESSEEEDDSGLEQEEEDEL